LPNQIESKYGTLDQLVWYFRPILKYGDLSLGLRRSLLRYDTRPGTGGIADIQDARPHLLVLMGPPNAQLLVLTYNPSTSSLIVASLTLLNPPTPSLRLAEFYRGVIVEGSTALISLWVGVLSCVELEVEKEKDLKRRRSSAVRPGMVNESVSDKRLRVRETFNIK
jgi:hypothetical protein